MTARRRLRLPQRRRALPARAPRARRRCCRSSSPTRTAPNETIWFDSVAATARECGIATLAPDDPNTPDVVARIDALAPDFLFSFYYRSMLKAPAARSRAARGAQHARLAAAALPRPRAGQLGGAARRARDRRHAALHDGKPDAGDIVAQIRGADPSRRHGARGVRQGHRRRRDHARRRAARAHRRHGAARAAGPGRRPSISADAGRKTASIDWKRDALSIHNLVRAVAPPYPGALHDVGGRAGARAAHARARSRRRRRRRRRRSKSATAGSSPGAAAAERSRCLPWSLPECPATRRRSSRASALRRCRSALTGGPPPRPRIIRPLPGPALMADGTPSARLCRLGQPSRTRPCAKS